ncbi:hypothetical protein L6164_000143 [Bauhinia variegata]|uniref:Uncharacterized protein n=1 Tax=Bauhinia variegata TaxID=167791 RepID=A0ACB9Q516_BAUVA|nr:hypothetical protein L6164_000143 [Bauhinia variegata]
MKPVSLALLLVLFTLSRKLDLTTAVYVYDVDGEPLLNGGSYYVVFDEPGGGPVTLAKVENETRPISVVLGSFFEDNMKRAVKFRVDDGLISFYVSTNVALDIEFTSSPVNSSTWSVGQKDLFVRIDNEEEGALPGIFKIKKHGSGHVYRIVFCPHGEACFPLGAEKVYPGMYQLIVTDGEPLPFIFEKVGFATSAI